MWCTCISRNSNLMFQIYPTFELDLGCSGFVNPPVFCVRVDGVHNPTTSQMYTIFF